MKMKLVGRKGALIPLHCKISLYIEKYTTDIYSKFYSFKVICSYLLKTISLKERTASKNNSAEKLKENRILVIVNASKTRLIVLTQITWIY